ncbi:hypothetical protein [Acinetobacter haemolyticus]|uniref:hypothetical protein n=1 Tax=Acinetobacter haemolyticus TaxID=29430 RepID=UPI000F741C3C|nr:hypothetical protein [Acinetobacter haemolyticus]RSN77893.1 hypothetical protein EA769_03480 [Acinetobacter haemolyticus]
MSLFVEGQLPVAIKVLDGQTELRLKKFEMTTLDVEGLLELHSRLESNQYTKIAEMCEQVKLIDDNGNAHTLLYESLMKSSKQNLEYLNAKRDELELKEQAEN